MNAGHSRKQRKRARLHSAPGSMTADLLARQPCRRSRGSATSIPAHLTRYANRRGEDEARAISTNATSADDRPRCARAQWPVGSRRSAMELAIQAGRAAAPPRDEFARFLRSVRRASRMRVVPSSTSGTGRPEATRGFLKFGVRPVRSIPASACRLRSQKACLKVALWRYRSRRGASRSRRLIVIGRLRR
mgnify:CR=1 FL=1